MLDKPLDEPTNEDRAEWAVVAAAAFAGLVYHTDDFDSLDEGDQEDALSDLICDLLHLAHQRGFNTTQMLERANGHFEEELREES